MKTRTNFENSCFKCEVKAGEKTTYGLSFNSKILAQSQIDDDCIQRETPCNAIIGTVG